MNQQPQPLQPGDEIEFRSQQIGGPFVVEVVTLHGTVTSIIDDDLLTARPDGEAFSVLVERKDVLYSGVECQLRLRARRIGECYAF